MATDTTTEQIAATTRNFITKLSPLQRANTVLSNLTNSFQTKEAEDTFEKVCADVGVSKPSQMPAQSPSSITPQSINTLNKVEEIVATLLQGAELFLGSKEKFLADIDSVCVLCNSLIWERAQMENELLAWKRKFEELAVLTLKVGIEKDKVSLAGRSNLIGRAPLF